MTLSRMSTRTSVVALCVLAMLFAATPATAQTGPDPTGAQGDFSGLVDIGGGRDCSSMRGQGGPTVVLSPASGTWRATGPRLLVR